MYQDSLVFSETKNLRKVGKTQNELNTDFIDQKTFKGYFRYKTITSQNVPFEVHFYFAKRFCSVLKIFKFLYF